MMLKHLYLLSLALLFFLVKADDDPCDNADDRLLPNLRRRYMHYSKLEEFYQDANLVEGWYSTKGNKMLDRAPEDIFSCGTKFPVWLNGTHPTQNNEVMEKTACMMANFQTPCHTKFDIKIRKCPTAEETFVYWLVPTQTSNSGYCFGVGVKGPIPSFKPTIKGVSFDLQTTISPRWKLPTSRVYFFCNFDASDENLCYRVFWYQNRELMLVLDCGSTSRDEPVILTEDRFIENGFELGTKLSCEVEAFYVKNGPPGPTSGRSEEFFAGLKILTPSLEFTYNDPDELKRTIQLQSTIPVGCTEASSCYIELLASIPEKSEYGQCSPVSVKGLRCGIKIQSENVVNSKLTITLQTSDTGQYFADSHNEVYLKTSPTLENKIWGNYALDKIKVHVKLKGNKVKSGSKCMSNNDPHMRSFDGRPYEIQPGYGHSETVYVLFMNEQFNSEVQIQVKRCGRAYCNCGVAVKSGQDIYVINGCRGYLKMDYVTCGDKYLKVKSTSRHVYKIFFPHGAYVVVQLWGLFMNVHVYPSVHDEYKTMGLCGILDGNTANDFHKRDGSVTNHRAFVDEWRVASPAEDMLSENFNKKNLTPLEIGVCTCIKGKQPGKLDDVSCDKNAVATCSKGRDTSSHSCSHSHIRTRRSVDRNPIKPTPKKMTTNTLKHSRLKRQSEAQNWTETEAETFCSQYMKKSDVYNLCEEKVPNSQPEIAIKDCISDILLTGGTDWAEVSKESMRVSCKGELEKNRTLWIPPDNYSTSIAETLSDIACPRNCSEAGICLKGTCECFGSFGGTDCSMDLSSEPEMHGILDNGLCDEMELPCSHAYVFAFPLTDDSTLTCRLQEFSISRDGERMYIADHTVEVEFNTITEVICPLDELRRKRSVSSTDSIFVLGYNISISNDGSVFSDGEDLYIFNSKCQQVSQSGGQTTFFLLDGYCFIDGECIINGTLAETDNCSLCDVSQSVEAWSFSGAIPGCSNSETTSSKLHTSALASNITVSMSPSMERDTISSGTTVSTSLSMRRDTVSSGTTVSTSPSMERDTVTSGTTAFASPSLKRDTVTSGTTDSSSSSMEQGAVTSETFAFTSPTKDQETVTSGNTANASPSVKRDSVIFTPTSPAMEQETVASGKTASTTGSLERDGQSNESKSKGLIIGVTVSISAVFLAILAGVLIKRLLIRPKYPAKVFTTLSRQSTALSISSTTTGNHKMANKAVFSSARIKQHMQETETDYD